MAVAITGAHLWDGHAPARSAGPVVVRVAGGRIEAIELDDGGAGPRRLTAEAKVLHYEGATLLPGLIDAHVHMSIDPRRGVGEQRRIPRELRWMAMVERAEAMVRVGITTARDLGGGDWDELRLRDRIADGDLPGPRLLCAGQPLTSVGGHCHFWNGEVSDVADVDRVIARQVAHRADWIKVMATGGVATQGTDPSRTQFDDATLAHAVAEAARHGRCVAAHCHGTAGIAQAARAGVRTIEHCSFAGRDGFGSDLDEAVIAEIARAGAFVSPTVNLGWGLRIEKEGAPTPFFERMSRAQRALREAGVPLIASTDAGIPGIEHHRLAEGLIALARYAALSPAEVLRAATSESARALGIDDETGAVRVGLAADLLVVPGDPLVCLRALRRPLAVVARGTPLAARAPGAPGRAQPAGASRSASQSR